MKPEISAFEEAGPYEESGGAVMTQKGHGEGLVDCSFRR